jgi:hypothetical protein
LKNGVLKVDINTAPSAMKYPIEGIFSRHFIHIKKKTYELKIIAKVILLRKYKKKICYEIIFLYFKNINYTNFNISILYLVYLTSSLSFSIIDLFTIIINKCKVWKILNENLYIYCNKKKLKRLIILINSFCQKVDHFETDRVIDNLKSYFFRLTTSNW